VTFTLLDVTVHIVTRKTLARKVRATYRRSLLRIRLAFQVSLRNAASDFTAVRDSSVFSLSYWSFIVEIILSSAEIFSLQELFVCAIVSLTFPLFSTKCCRHLQLLLFPLMYRSNLNVTSLIMLFAQFIAFWNCQYQRRFAVYSCLDLGVFKPRLPVLSAFRLHSPLRLEGSMLRHCEWVVYIVQWSLVSCTFQNRCPVLPCLFEAF